MSSPLQRLSAWLLPALFSLSLPALAADPEWEIAMARGEGAEMVPVCLYRTPALFFGGGTVRAILGNHTGVVCKEQLLADINQRTLYLDIPGFDAQGQYLNGAADAHCPDQAGALGYSVCSSSFFKRVDGNPQFRVLIPELVKSTVRESGVFAQLEKGLAKMRKSRESAVRAVYLNDFAEAKTKDDFERFEKRYAGNDPDNLIPILKGKKPVENPKYRKDFMEARTAEQLTAFIATYENNDPANLVPEARARLSVFEDLPTVKKAIVADEAAQEKAVRRISLCRKQIAQSQEVVSKAQAGDTENAKEAQAAGEIVIMCRTSIATDFAEYQRLGGKKSLDEIR